jgi:dihydroflavonol-4-reductase
VAAAERGRCGERYILGGENLTHLQLFTLLAEVVGSSRPWLRLPDWAIEPAAASLDLARRILPMPLDGNQLRLSRHRLFCDTAKARDQLGIVNRRSARQAIIEALAWYRAHGVA